MEARAPRVVRLPEQAGPERLKAGEPTWCRVARIAAVDLAMLRLPSPAELLRLARWSSGGRLGPRTTLRRGPWRLPKARVAEAPCVEAGPVA